MELIYIVVLNMCICINCRHVHNCTTYRVIQKQHQQSVDSIPAFFIPNNTLIDVNIDNSSNLTQFDWDLVECSSFVEEPGKWLFSSINY